MGTSGGHMPNKYNGKLLRWLRYPIKSDEATELHRRMSQTIRLGLCPHRDLQSLETYDKIANGLLKDIKYVLYGEYIKR